MSRKTLAALFTATLLLSATCAANEDADDAAAKAAAVRFLDAFCQGTLEDVMPTVAVPWYIEGKTVIADTEELKQEFDRQLRRRQKKDPPRLAVKTVLPYRAVRDQIAERERRMLDRAIGPDDRLVLVHLNRPSTDKPESYVLYVRLESGAGKVVGIKE
jgi:hypothetical protein